MLRRKPLSIAVTAAIGAASTLISPFTTAQDVDEALVEEVVVTGSRIANANLIAPTPITTVSAEAIEFTGSVNPADILRTLPAVGVSGISNTNSNFSVASGGLNTVNLRNLGEDRTLVLVNGRRYVSGLAGNNAVDFNTIPTELIERMEVITGGASAIYGSDALAGVVNVILKDDFEGLRVNFQGGETAEGDGEQQRFNILMGGNFADGRGNAVMNFTYTDDGGILARDRENTTTDLIDNCFFTGNPADCQDIVRPFFSSFPPQGRFIIPITGQSLTIASGTGAGAQVKPFVSAEDGFNRQQFRRYTIPTERTLATANFRFDVNDNVEAYSELMFARTETATEIEPFPLSGVGDLGVGISIDNPFMPQEIRDAAIAAGNDEINFVRRTVELEQRGASATRQTIRALFGLRGDINDDWSWDAFVSRAYMEDTQISTGQVNTSNFRDALDVTTDADGNLICRNAAARGFGCVPVNVFGVGAISAEAARFLTAPALRTQKTEQTNAAITFNGDLFEMPAGTVSMAAGWEYREEFAADLPDALVRTGQNGGNASAPTQGEFDVNEFFAEVEVPLLADAPFAQALSVGAAYRYSDYNTIGNTDAYTARFSWQPIEQVRVRGQYARAVRAPNINELFAPGGENFAPVSDPCDGITATTPGVVAENCRAVPSIAARIAETGSFTLTQPEQQGVGGFTGRGNPNLEAETADTYTLGAVYTDDFDSLGSLTVSVDWYEIEIDKFIATVARQTSIDFCYNQTNFPNAFCDFVDRDGAGPAFQQGEITGVNSGFINEGVLKTSGIDLQVDWSKDLFNGTLNLRMVYAYLDDYTETRFGEADDQTNEVGLAEHEFLFTALYSTADYVVQWETLYIGESVLDNSSSLNYDVESFMSHDLFAAYNITDSVRIAAGVDNVFDEDAPLILPFFAQNTTGWATNGGVYGTGGIGRSYYVNIDWSF